MLQETHEAIQPTPLEIAIDKEHTFKNTAEITGNQTYVPISEVADNILSMFDNKANMPVIGIIAKRNMTVGQFSTLAALMNPNFRGENLENPPRTLNDSQMTEAKTLMSKNIMVPGETLGELFDLASKNSMEVGDLIRSYGSTQAQDEASMRGVSIEQLSQEATQDINGNIPPNMARVQRNQEAEIARERKERETEFNNNQAQIRAELDGLKNKKPDDIYLNMQVGQMVDNERQSAMTELADTMGVKWSDLDPKAQSDILAMGTTDAYVTLAKLSPKATEGLQRLAKLETEHEKARRELDNLKAANTDKANVDNQAELASIEAKTAEAKKALEERTRQRQAELESNIAEFQTKIATEREADQATVAAIENDPKHLAAQAERRRQLEEIQRQIDELRKNTQSDLKASKARLSADLEASKDRYHNTVTEINERYDQ